MATQKRAKKATAKSAKAKPIKADQVVAVTPEEHVVEKSKIPLALVILLVVCAVASAFNSWQYYDKKGEDDAFKKSTISQLQQGQRDLQRQQDLADQDRAALRDLIIALLATDDPKKQEAILQKFIKDSEARDQEQQAASDDRDQAAQDKRDNGDEDAQPSPSPTPKPSRPPSNPPSPDPIIPPRPLSSTLDNTCRVVGVCL